MRPSIALCSFLLVAGCGGGGTATLGAPSVTPTATSPAPTPTHKPVPPKTGPHFATPEAAMRYLAVAWNRHDLVSLKHVTDPAARFQLTDMYSEATNLKLDHCKANPAGDYECFFTHDYPKGYTKTGHGTAEFTVGPADRPGWYMTYFEGCG